jgi:hypothetical protein
MVEYMKEELEHLEGQRKRAKEALADIEKTISEIKNSTGYKIHSMLEQNNLNGVKKINTKHDGTHVFFEGNEISAKTLERFKKFKLGRLYTENGNMVAVFD